MNQIEEELSNLDDVEDEIHHDTDDEGNSPIIDKNLPTKRNPNQDEIYRLAGRSPLMTILNLMIGPILTQVTGALYGVINTIWVSRAIGEIGMSAVATEYCFECIGRAFGYFLQSAGTTQISYLYGQKLEGEAPQVVVDILRFSILCAASVPALLIPIHDPVAKWYGASPETIKEGYNYLLPFIVGAIFPCINMACAGFLQAEGRTMLIGVINIVSLGISMAGLVPLFLYGFKSGIIGTSIATILADAIPGVILVILYFAGFFGVKPKVNMLFKPFSKHTWKALGVGSSQLVSQLALNIPGIFIRKLIGLSTDPVDYDNAMSGFNVFCRYNQIVNCLVIAVTTGYIPPASYAYAAKDSIRYLWLSFHSAWIAFAWSVFTTILSLTIPRQISMMFSSGEDFLSFSAPMLKVSTALNFIMWMRFNAQAMLQALQSGGRAMIISFVSNFVATIGFAYVLYFTDKHNVIRLMWVYPISIAVGFVFGLALLLKPLLQMYRSAKTQSILEGKDQVPEPLDHPDLAKEKPDVSSSADEGIDHEGTDIDEL
ncbi:hypothetical protein TRFO_13638 [Tritrichomonas foetus]|uniref:MatE family protein n=1 Tax=Tritrichomonas foetus TaxID=1144522 RepID=A0A1J4KXH4_9EUKA|nr:hypothetical protein TRFO_13638 [Tritrichomonas foetus]|eukprot:OHT15953.1 hypothetical protein TRFO_13638 [Tritrichomonas foetus]